RQRDGEADDQRQNDQAHTPVWDFKEWENLGRDLREQPRGHTICNGNAHNVAFLKLTEEDAAATSCAQLLTAELQLFHQLSSRRGPLSRIHRKQAAQQLDHRSGNFPGGQLLAPQISAIVLPECGANPVSANQSVAPSE